MKSIDEIIDELDLADDTYSRRTRVHDWRNHIGSSMWEVWPSLTIRERALLALSAQDRANLEEWD